MATISVDGEQIDNKNHAAIAEYASALKAVGASAVPLSPSLTSSRWTWRTSARTTA
jgi:hypothetical protein